MGRRRKNRDAAAAAPETAASAVASPRRQGVIRRTFNKLVIAGVVAGVTALLRRKLRGGGPA